MEASIWFWVTFNAAVLGLLLLDLGVFSKKDANGDPLPVPVKTALLKSGAYFVLAMCFAAYIWMTYGVTPQERQTKALEFVTGYVIEWSLSVDNIFVFVLIFTKFAVPAQYQHRVLFWGILGALTMRAIMIFAGIGFMMSLNHVLLRLSAMLPDEVLRSDVRLFAGMNGGLIGVFGLLVGVQILAGMKPVSTKIGAKGGVPGFAVG